MGCSDCNKRKDRQHIEQLAEKVAMATGEAQQVYTETTWEGDIFDFEPLGIQREHILKIIRISEGKYKAISVTNQQ